LLQQSLFCLNSPHGAIDVFRTVRGLGDWHDARQRALAERTAGGVPYLGLSDGDMLQCQRALDPADQKQDRIKALQSQLGQQP
jgi:hypothetical protein